MNEVALFSATNAISLPSGESASDVICQLELRACDARERRNRRITPPSRAQRRNFPLVPIFEPLSKRTSDKDLFASYRAAQRVADPARGPQRAPAPAGGGLLQHFTPAGFEYGSAPPFGPAGGTKSRAIPRPMMGAQGFNMFGSDSEPSSRLTRLNGWPRIPPTREKSHFLSQTRRPQGEHGCLSRHLE